MLPCSTTIRLYQQTRSAHDFCRKLYQARRLALSGPGCLQGVLEEIEPSLWVTISTHSVHNAGKAVGAAQAGKQAKPGIDKENETQHLSGRANAQKPLGLRPKALNERCAVQAMCTLP